MRRVADRLACAWAVRHPLRQEGCGPVHPGVQPSLVREHACMIEFCHAGVLVEAARGSQSSACCAWTGTQKEGGLASPGQYPETVLHVLCSETLAHGVPFCVQAGDYQKTARFYYKKAEDTYYQANNWAAYDDWRRARDQWDYFYSRNR